MEQYFDFEPMLYQCLDDDVMMDYSGDNLIDWNLFSKQQSFVENFCQPTEQSIVIDHRLRITEK